MTVGVASQEVVTNLPILVEMTRHKIEEPPFLGTFLFYGSVHHESILIVKQRDATVRSQFYFTARSFSMFRV